MSKSERAPRNTKHTLINVALVAFLILVATIGMRSLNYSAGQNETIGQSSNASLENVMICAIGQCIIA